jgi:Rieske Fe-S protein
LCVSALVRTTASETVHSFHDSVVTFTEFFDVTGAPDIPRRDVIRAAVCLALCPLTFGCAESAPATAPALEFADDAATVRGETVDIDVTRVPQWRGSDAIESAVVFLTAQVIVVRRPGDRFSALSAVCPHAGCGVSMVRSSELVCPCHGSTFSFAGERLAGPALQGLTPLSATYDAASKRLTIRRSSG